MRRRVISVGSVLIAVAALGVVLLNATLVDRRAPAVTAIRLSAGVEGQANVAHTLTAVEVEFSEPVETATVDRRFRIEPRVAGALVWEGNNAVFTPTEPLPPDSPFTITIDPGYEDLAGNVAETGTTYAFRTVGPPAVVETLPADATEGVLPDATLSITFDRLMDTAAVEAAIDVEPDVPVEPTWSGPVLTLGFGGELAYGTTYSVTIGADAADTDGSRLRAPFTTTFTTVAAGLEVVRTIPAEGTAGVSVGAPIAVLFDSPIDPASIEGALTVTPPVDGDLRIVPLPSDESATAEEPPGTVLLLEPGDDLAAHTTYTVTLGATVARAGAPEVVAADRTWTFTTGQPTRSGHNQVAYLTARGGNRDVWLMNPDGSAQRQLTSGLAPVSAFDVTVDGSRVAFASGGVVRLMGIDGSDESVLTADGRFEYAPRFSPDGRRLLVARRAEDGADAGWWLVPLDATAGDEVQLLPGGAPPLGSTTLAGDGLEASPGLPVWASRAAWEPSGRWLLLTTAQGGVALVDLEAGAERVTAVALGSSSAPAWSPVDEAFLVVGRSPDAEVDALYSVGLDGSVTERPPAVGSVAVDADGRVALLVEDDDGVARLAVGRTTGSQPLQPLEPLADDEELADRAPAFGPDGTVVLFGRVRGDGLTSAGIWSIDARGDADPVRLTMDGAYPRWLP